MTEKSSGQNFIHKSYQVLFVLYAPFALATIALTIFSEKYLHFVFITAVLASIMSLIIAVIMWVLFWRHRDVIEEENTLKLPYLIRHQFILLYLPVTFICFLFCTYYIYTRYISSQEDSLNTSFKQITILVPMEDTLGQPMENYPDIQHALGSFFTDYSELTTRYHFNLLDHHNYYNQALEARIVELISTGTDYIVCGYSTVCVELAENLERLTKAANTSSAPILISTLSSSMNFPLQKNHSYRFYIRNKEDSLALAKYAFENGLERLSFIAENDEYGRDAINELKINMRNFGGEVVDGIYVDTLLTESVVSEAILKQEHRLNDADAIVIALYQNANTALVELAGQKPLLLSANYPYSLYEDMLKQTEISASISVSVPVFKVENPYIGNNAGIFLYLTLEKLISSDQQVMSGGDFHAYWMSEEEPFYLQFSKDGALDFRIELEARPMVEVVDLF